MIISSHPSLIRTSTTACAVFLIIISMLPTRAFIYGHLYGNGIQQWINKEEGVKIQFKYTLYKPEINNYHQLNFSIQDLETGKHLKNLTASVTITNDPLFAFDNITISNGDFVVVCPFLDQGEHQVILSVRSGLIQYDNSTVKRGK